MNSKKGNNSTFNPHVPHNLDLGLIFMLIRSNFVSLPCKILSGTEFYSRTRLLKNTHPQSSPCCSQSWSFPLTLQAYPVCSTEFYSRTKLLKIILDDLSFGFSMLFTILTWCMFSGIFASLPCQIVCQCADNVLFAQYVVKVCLKFPSIQLQESASLCVRQTYGKTYAIRMLYIYQIDKLSTIDNTAFALNAIFALLHFCLQFWDFASVKCKTLCGAFLSLPFWLSQMWTMLRCSIYYILYNKA